MYQKSMVRDRNMVQLTRPAQEQRWTLVQVQRALLAQAKRTHRLVQEYPPTQCSILECLKMDLGTNHRFVLKHQL